MYITVDMQTTDANPFVCNQLKRICAGANVIKFAPGEMFALTRGVATRDLVTARYFIVTVMLHYLPIPMLHTSMLTIGQLQG